MIHGAESLQQTYGRFPLVIERGEGCYLFDSDGKRYLDFLSGIAVVSAGHANPAINSAVVQQMQKLWHVSNLFYNPPMLALAEKLRAITGWGRVFFANSGAEANEAAIKLVRKWAGKGRYKILCAEGSFHGRTLAALAATGQPAKWQGFEPLPAGFSHHPYNDLAAFERAVDSETAAILLEPIQGEGGVIPASAEFLIGIRKLCCDRNLALVFDEVQCGIGRTGVWWAFQSYGVKPDIITSAKALGNGLPISACIADEPFASVFVPGDHASTFGGGAVASAAALATLEYIEREGCLENAANMEVLCKRRFIELPGIKEVRGLGLMLGLVLEKPYAKNIATKCLEEGLIVNAVRDDVLRLTPPLIIAAEQVQEAYEILKSALNQTASV